MKFDVLEPRRCEDKTGIVAPDRDPKCFGTFEKQPLSNSNDKQRILFGRLWIPFLSSRASRSFVKIRIPKWQCKVYVIDTDEISS